MLLFRKNGMFFLPKGFFSKGTGFQFFEGMWFSSFFQMVWFLLFFAKHKDVFFLFKKVEIFSKKLFSSMF